jgi:hypothetical protein
MQNGTPLEERGGTSASYEDLNTVIRGLRNLDVQPFETQHMIPAQKQRSVYSANSSGFKMETFWEEGPYLSEVEGQCFALRGLSGFQSDMKINGTKYADFSNGKKEQRTRRKGKPRAVVSNAGSVGSHRSNQPYGQNEIPDLSERKSERVRFKNANTFNSSTGFRVAHNSVQRFVSRPSCICVEELSSLCRMLTFMCKNAMSLQPNTYRELVILAKTRPVHARQCYQLAQLIFFLSAFSSQMLSVLENVMQTLAVLNVTDFQPRELISAIRKVASAFPLLDMEVEYICCRQVRRAYSDVNPVQEIQPKQTEQTVSHWQLLAASKQLDIAGEHLEMASQLLRIYPQHDDGCSLDSSKCPMHSEKYFQTACPQERLTILALKFSSIEKKIVLLKEVVKHSEYKQ